MKKIKLLVIEENRLLRNGIAALLKNQNDIKLVTVSEKDGSALTKINRLKPEVILLDLGLRNKTSLSIVEEIKKDFPASKLIIMDLAPVPGDIELFVKAGASGFILKDTTLNDFIQIIRGVADGSKILPPDLNQSLFTQIIDHAMKSGKMKLNEAIRMTKREKEVMHLIANGHSNKEIAKKLEISAFTVKSHVHNIMEKLALHTRLEVASYSNSTAKIKKSKDVSG